MIKRVVFGRLLVFGVRYVHANLHWGPVNRCVKIMYLKMTRERIQENTHIINSQFCNGIMLLPEE